MLSSLSFPSFLAVPVIVIVTIFIVWSSIGIFSEGQKEIPSIKITSPTNGQNISTGTNLTISGLTTGTNTSSTITGDSNSGNRCYVSVIINNIKPYHNATAGGANGVDDYSKWYYTLSTIKEGQNRLTGKLSCLMEGNSNINSINVSNTTNNLIKWYSVNVTGVSTSTTSTVNRNYQTITNSTTQLQPQQQQSNRTEGNTTLSSNSSAITNASHSNNKSNSSSPSIPKENNSNKIATSSGSLSAKLTQSPSTTKSTSNYKYNNNHNNAKPLSISIQSSQNIVNGRGASTISATAYDVVTGKKIDNAIVTLKITFTSNGTSKEIVGHNGEVTYSAEIKPNSKDSSNISFRTTVQASAPGYISTSKTTTSSGKKMSTSNSNRQESIINNNLTQTILKNVQKKLKQNGIDIALS
jgi:hypothetical protein